MKKVLFITLLFHCSILKSQTINVSFTWSWDCNGQTIVNPINCTLQKLPNNPWSTTTNTYLGYFSFPSFQCGSGTYGGNNLEMRFIYDEFASTWNVSFQVQPNSNAPIFAWSNFASIPNPPSSAVGNYGTFNDILNLSISGSGTQGVLTLPVSLTSFTAQKTTNGTVLNWKTASENNNKGFDIEKSTDGTNFTKIGFVNGNNTSQDVQHYQYTDNAACTGRQLYRLKQIDNDNNFKYSSVATVNCGPVKNVTISPNPAASTITIVADNWVVAKLVNTNGQTVSTIRPAVSNTQQADVSKLPNGLYVLQLIYKDGSMTAEKIQVIH